MDINELKTIIENKIEEYTNYNMKNTECTYDDGYKAGYLECLNDVKTLINEE